jgi:D-alanine-D-alanine ligase
MRVALVYNQKKEDATQQSVPGTTTHSPDSSSETSPPSVHRSTNQSQLSTNNDLYAEWDTFETIDAMRKALAEVHDVTLIEADEFAYEKLRNERPDIVFNITEGLFGVSREAQMPAMLEMLQIPYTGSDPLTLAICLDKSRAKEILSYYNIPTPRFRVISTISQLIGCTIPLPCMVKPLHEGSSKGIFDASLVLTKQELEKQVSAILSQYNEPALVEEYLPGREFTVAMLGNGNNVKVLPIVEIKFDSLPSGVNPIYSYEAKWIWDKSDAPLDIFECPAQIESSLRKEIEFICREAYSVLRCRDWARIDVRLDAYGQPQIIELNPLPGILPNPEDNSCFPKAARAAGLTYNELIQTVIDIAAKRCGVQSKRVPVPHTI